MKKKIMDKKEATKRDVVIEELKKNCRISLTLLSRRTNIPVSTLYNLIKELEKEYFFTIERRKNDEII